MSRWGAPARWLRTAQRTSSPVMRTFARRRAFVSSHRRVAPAWPPAELTADWLEQERGRRGRLIYRFFALIQPRSRASIDGRRSRSRLGRAVGLAMAGLVIMVALPGIGPNLIASGGLGHQVVQPLPSQAPSPRKTEATGGPLWSANAKGPKVVREL